MKHSFIIVFILAVAGQVQSQNEQTKYAALITKSDLLENLSILAADALEGRRTGTRGQKMAAAFISTQFQDLGLSAPNEGSYYQTFNLYKSLPGKTFVKVDGNVFSNFNEVVLYGSSDSNGEITSEVVFVGRGTEEELKQVDVNTKTALFWMKQFSFAAMSQSVQRLREAGASLILIYSSAGPDEFRIFASQMKSFIEETSISLEKPITSKSGLFLVHKKVVEALYGKNNLEQQLTSSKKMALKKVKPASITYQISTKVENVPTENVLGYLEGSDKKDEVIVITAHYDHIGKNASGTGDLINNGADDDGSGTVAVLQLAKAFAQAKVDGSGPRRSILFMTVTAEELGLFGSDYYTQFPVFPLANTVVDLNIDMIGRWDNEHKNQPDYVYVIGSDKLSSELHEINERNNANFTRLSFDYTYNDEHHPTNLYKRSDHWNFAKHGIPIIFYFDGIHEDYHRPSDEVSKIDFDILAKRVQCVFYTAWEIANREERLKVDK